MEDEGLRVGVRARLEWAPEQDRVVAALELAVELAREDIARYRRLSDPRYLGRAQAVLAPWWSSPRPPDEVLLLRATIRQALHDFAGARVDLDALIARDPDSPQARLTRAVVATVTGDLAQASADCAAVDGELIRAACAAPLGWSSGDPDSAYARIDRALRDAREAPPAVLAWAHAAAGDAARQAGDDVAAEAHLRAALAAIPDDGYALGALADLLLDRGRAVEVIGLLVDHVGADNLLLRLAIAERATDAAAAAEHAALLRARYAGLLERGDRTHLREQARFALAIDGDATGALALARAGWALQHEPADVRIVLEAARAADDPAGAAEVLTWLDAHDAKDAVIARLREELAP